MTLSAETADPVLTVPGAPPAFHVMAKPTGAVCNLDCEYCFFLSKEMLYPGNRFRMAAGLARDGVLAEIGEDHIYDSVNAAVAASNGPAEQEQQDKVPGR